MYHFLNESLRILTRTIKTAVLLACCGFLIGCSQGDERNNVAQGKATPPPEETKDPRTVESLLAALQDQSSEVREKAAAALGEKKDSRAVEPLIAGLQDKELQVRWAAALALGKLQDERAVPPLLTALKDKGSQAQEETSWALGKIGSPAVDPLIATLEDKDISVRAAAASALGRIEDQRAAASLLTALYEKNLPVVAGASTFFIRKGEPGTEPILIAALKAHGTHAMAASFLGSGNSQLEEAANDWAPKHDQGILPTMAGGPKWGESR